MPDRERHRIGWPDLGRASHVERGALDQDSRAVRDAGHPHHGRWRGRLGGLRNVQPDARLEVNRPAGTVIADLLQVVQAEDLDVILNRATVRYGSADAAEVQ